VDRDVALVDLDDQRWWKFSAARVSVQFVACDDGAAADNFQHQFDADGGNFAADW